MFNWATSAAIRQISKRFGGGSILDMGNQRLDKHIQEASGCSTVREYYTRLGFEPYLALDVNEEKDAVVFDLNHVGISHINYYLVVNNGTSEHLFNQYAFFRNMHEACKYNGYMLHVVPFLPWVNHGFYNYNPILFGDLADINQYEIEFFWIGNRDGYYEDVTNEGWLFLEKHPVKLECLIHDMLEKCEKDLFIICCFRKLVDDVFRIPMQDKYVADIADDDVRQTYQIGKSSSEIIKEAAEFYDKTLKSLANR